MNNFEEYAKILSTEYSEEFDKIRKRMMVMSYYKYGPLKENADNMAYDFLGTLKKRLRAYENTKNTEFLADIANYCMMLFMYPEEGAHYTPTDSNQSPGIEGMSIEEIKQW